MSRAVAVALVLVTSLAVPLAATAGASAAAPAATTDAGTPAASSPAATDTPTIEKSIRLHLTPGDPGEIGVTVTYAIPEPVTSLRVRLPADARDLRSDSFSRDDAVVRWDGETAPATLRFAVDANQSATGARVESVDDSPAGSVSESAGSGAATAQQSGYAFVDAGPWALVTVPGLGTEWTWRNAQEVTLAEDVAVAGEGATGGELAYLGPVATHSRTANGQTFTFVVPERATLAASPDAILDGLAGLSGRLRVGTRDSKVWLVAAPTDVEWSVQGIEYGGTDFWVVADAELADPGNVWFHEYVHTRQDFTTTTSGRWTTEAMADYYAALGSLRRGYVGFSSFARYLGRGADSPWTDDVLARPATWSVGTNYVKGALVWGVLDRRLRLGTENSHTMADVFWRLNRLDGPVSNGDVLDAVAAESSPELAALAERYTTTRAAPEMWSRFEHSRAFSTAPARMEYDVREYRVAGPFRNQTFDELPDLYVGETLVVAGNVTNVGGADGEYSATLSVDDDVVATDEGTLQPAATASIALTHEFDAPGTYNVTLGRNTVPVPVQRPATPTVNNVSVAGSAVSPGGQVTVTATLASPGDAPAAGTVPVTVDGDQVATLDVALPPGESVTRTVTVTIDDPGAHTIAVGDQQARATAGEDSGTSVPGFGVAAALVAVLVAALVASRER